METEILITGFGGQGIVLTGNILGMAATLYDNRHATMTQSYGPEARGGSCSSQVVISDEPYRAHVYDGATIPETVSIITNCVVANSYSKAWAVAGERIGYLAISPRLEGAGELIHACTFTNRILGFINAPAIWQWVAAEASEAGPDLAMYQAKRDLLCENLASLGYEVRKPQGAFYLFMKTPIPDDLAFVRMLANEGVLTVPGTGFGRSGYIRLSLTVPRDTIVRSMPGFARALEKCPK